ncbi:MAG: phosphotransferase [Nocardioidaceae bacterium]
MELNPMEEQLAGGNVGTAVVRVGDTVRRPSGPWSLSVDALLSHLNSVGYAGAPRSLGFDELGRHVLEYIEGDVLMPFKPGDHLGSAHRVGALIRDFHDASEEFVPPADARWNVVIAPDAEDLLIHHDLAPWNLVLGGDRWVFIDWDNAGPGSRLWDLAYAAHGFIPLAPDTDAASAIQRMAALADGYRLDQDGRSNLAEMLVPRIMSMYDLLRERHKSSTQPWARLWAEGHGRVWLDNAEYAERHREDLREGLMRSQ